MGRVVLLTLVGIIALATLASATPLACASACTIQASSSGYVAPTFEIRVGAPLVWHSTDIAHVQQQGVAGGLGCLGVVVHGNEDSPAVTFSISSGQLFATVGTSTSVCTSAVALPDGSFALPYYCAIHPAMRGSLVVSP